MEITREELEKIADLIKNNGNGIYKIKVKNGKLIQAWQEKKLAITSKNEENMV